MNKTVFFNLFFFSILAVNTNISAQSADIILTNGKIFTSDINHLFVQALAIKGDKIIAAGSNEEIKKLADTKSQRIDLGG